MGFDILRGREGWGGLIIGRKSVTYISFLFGEGGEDILGGANIFHERTPSKIHYNQYNYLSLI